MPADFEVVANDCKIASQVLDAGIASHLADRVIKPEFQYICSETVEPSLTAWQIFVALYIVVVIPTLIGWAILYRRRTPAENFFILGALSMVFPVIAPIIILLNVGQEAEDVELAMQAGPGLLFERRRHADDQN